MCQLLSSRWNRGKYIVLFDCCVFLFRLLTLCFQPSNLTREHFVLEQKRSGDYAGKEALRLLNHKCEKTKKLTLGDFHCRKSDGQFDMVEFESDEFSIVKLYKHIEEHFMPDVDCGIEVGRFFCRRAAEKELRKRKKGVSRFLLGCTRMMFGGLQVRQSDNRRPYDG